ncbi:F0F1 ATP synthase subunit delta [Pseudazoarcus pumilus]|uniref:ATP synthase subunit delta n=1 Tax=Pseudazoarcus pumilus TaxID=2067960 RepID=A0A2I6SAB3_9RHOO|nr:F0F1 ATP synthase subunit delta [Pseudazoarcus pumilus]AUN96193.1 F0F1 ATP synthase subunit delta [Pseudazoarcus pumilus]
MAENLTIARPYADAAFEQAKAEKALGQWLDLLDRLSAIVSDEAMQAAVRDPKLTDEQVCALVTGVAGEGLGADQQNFVRILVENDRLQVLPQIRDLFVQKKNGHEGVLEADVSSAFPLDDAARAKLQKDLEAHFKAKLNVHVRVDPELIGGVRIAVGDDVIDTSVRGKLANMAAALKN